MLLQTPKQIQVQLQITEVSNRWEWATYILSLQMPIQIPNQIQLQTTWSAQWQWTTRISSLHHKVSLVKRKSINLHSKESRRQHVFYLLIAPLYSVQSFFRVNNLVFSEFFAMIDLPFTFPLFVHTMHYAVLRCNSIPDICQFWYTTTLFSFCTNSIMVGFATTNRNSIATA